MTSYPAKRCSECGLVFPSTPSLFCSVCGGQTDSHPGTSKSALGPVIFTLVGSILAWILLIGAIHALADDGVMHPSTVCDPQSAMPFLACR